MRQSLLSSGLPLPGVAPCYVEPEFSERGVSFLVTRRSLSSSFGLLGGLLLVVSMFLFPLSMWLLFIHAFGTPRASGLATGVFTIWLFQMIASADLLCIEDTTATYSKKRWWRWRDKPIAIGGLKKWLPCLDICTEGRNCVSFRSVPTRTL